MVTTVLGGHLLITSKVTEKVGIPAKRSPISLRLNNYISSVIKITVKLDMHIEYTQKFTHSSRVLVVTQILNIVVNEKELAQSQIICSQ